MKYLKYILKTKRYYISIAVQLVLSLVILLCFSGRWTDISAASKTYNNCTADFIAYDSFPDESDSYANFESSYAVTLTGQDGEAVNAHVYQFLENTGYTDKSIVNGKNVTAGEYSVLQYGEIALPQSTADSLGAAVGGKLYVGGVCCEIKYIYRDIYQIYAVDFDVSRTVVFVGIGTLDVENCVDYCNFNPSDTMHNSLKSLNDVREELLAFTVIYAVSAAVLTFAVMFAAGLFRNKSEVNTMKICLFAGEKRIFAKTAAAEILYLAPVCIFLCISGLLYNGVLSLALWQAAASAVCCALRLPYLYFKVKR